MFTPSVVGVWKTCTDFARLHRALLTGKIQMELEENKYSLVKHLRDVGRLNVQNLMLAEMLSPDKGRISKGDQEFQIKMAVPLIERLRK